MYLECDLRHLQCSVLNLKHPFATTEQLRMR